MITPTEIAQAETELAKLDPVLGAVIKLQAPLNRLREGTYFGNLTRSIVSQQISVAAAASILRRLTDATALDPLRVAGLSLEELRALGLSRSKGSYIHDLAEHFIKDAAVFDHLDRLPDDEVIAELVSVKGIGVWTAQMFLMFTLGRLDVFAPDDVGLQRAIKLLYNLPDVPPKAELVALSDKWRPYRTVACWHLWESLDNAPA
ncbi:MAG TPA: DNA-3-methyladenine glycosylase 2 family protein [Candidatus Saccharimonadia bacterium]|jgi:DNA-3-methyladenine glycosylase II|nr:DNA-3-methyladenine glycosylase 2 family protein [Candidatus Saccharimonadia bacterium]